MAQEAPAPGVPASVSSPSPFGHDTMAVVGADFPPRVLPRGWAPDPPGAQAGLQHALCKVL